MAIEIGIKFIDNLQQARTEIMAVGSDAAGWQRMAPKAVHRVLKLTGVTPVQANIIKQEMLARGGEAAVARGVVNCSVEATDVLLMATLKQYQEFIAKLKMQPFGLPKLAERLQQALDNLEGRPLRRLNCRGRELTLGGRTLVMGILNATPDSFSDGGRYQEPAAALEHALHMVEAGADIIDLGGVSTRPGHSQVSEEEELKRVLPVLQRLVQEVPVPISVDTWRARVAREALAVGAHIINDQWALRGDPGLAAVIAQYQVPVILMHNGRDNQYRDIMSEMIAFLRQGIDLACAAGLARENIIIDPGIGFAKTYQQNLEVLRRLKELNVLGCPILLGTSRKSVIAKTLDLPVDQRVEGTGATVALGIAGGADIIRVHDVKEMVRVARMTDAIVRGNSHVG
ncbi:dihydropteroate synthase [Desulforamulus hydrothermalis]|uniref:Dihydropteroate synthase n=1 Tax=Desulforamulus hydrothermalis Lam5 = DSM 18033 TaxID=1121428 RepID=K8DZZ1_9FIRM|nr:dihydropteroate synthase [Desulforamulus hydrothermalis]CCO08670.1 Dihydropteroate synthase [Desulforamulus hydrothermalis Lam5 = DSM 18033]SHH38920.1 Dihydropteroate synthase [Desulforamulus hydrothermalis Lam5 = DSM 18033]